jgi:hypothetical protein
MKSVSEMPVGSRFMYDGKEMIVTCKRGTVVQAKFNGVEGIYQIFFGFEKVEPIN